STSPRDNAGHSWHRCRRLCGRQRVDASQDAHRRSVRVSERSWRAVRHAWWFAVSHRERYSFRVRRPGGVHTRMTHREARSQEAAEAAPTSSASGDVTQLLRAFSLGDRAAYDALVPLVYAE